MSQPVPDPWPGTPQPEPGRPAASRSVQLITWVLTAVVGVFVAVALVRNWGAVREELATISWANLVASGLAAVGAMVCSGLAWRVVLAGLGSRMPLLPAGTVFFVGQLGKYVPGSVWTAAIQAEMGRRQSVPRTRMVLSYVIALLIALVTGVVAALLAFVGGDVVGQAGLMPLLMAVALAVTATLVRPQWANATLASVARRLGRPAPQLDLPPTALAGAVALNFLVWCLFGLHVWALAEPMGAGLDSLPRVTGAMALAFVTGLVVVPLPAGAGVREGVLVALLAGSIGPAAALTVSLVSRLVLLVVDIVLAAAFLVGRGAGRSDEAE